MNSKSEGLRWFGNLLMAGYLTLGIKVVGKASILMGVLYAAVIGFSFFTIAYAMCAKCPRRLGKCTHLYLGRLTLLLPRRKAGRNTVWDNLGMGLYLAGLHLFPAYWLWQNKILFGLFYLSAVLTFLILSYSECPDCNNIYCPSYQGERKCP